MGAWVNHAPKKTTIPRASGLVRELLVFSKIIHAKKIKCVISCHSKWRGRAEYRAMSLETYIPFVSAVILGVNIMVKLEPK